MDDWRRRGLALLLGALCLFFIPSPAVAQEGGGDTHTGDVFGDLYHVKRDTTTGQPILQKRWIEYPGDVFGWGYCPIPVDMYGQEIPFAPDSCEVDPLSLDRIVELDYFGRLSAGRTKERNSRMHFDEVISNIKLADVVVLEPAGRFRLGTGCLEGVCQSWKIIDSPQENLAVYARLLRYGHIQTDPMEVDVDFHGDPETGIVYHPALGPEDWAKFTGVLVNVLPSGSASGCFTGSTFTPSCAAPQPLTAEDFVRAASFLGGAADKHDKITIDLIQYLNRILKITKKTDYSLPTLNTLPVLIRDETGFIRPPLPDEALVKPADERLVDYAAAAYQRDTRFNIPMESGLVEVSPGIWQATPNLGFVNFLRFINGVSLPLVNAPAFVLNSLDAVRAVEFVHEYEVPADIRAPGALTITSVLAAAVGLSPASQVVTLTASIVNSLPVNGGTVTFTVQTADGTPVGVPVVSAQVVNGAVTADYILPPLAEPGVLTIVGAYGGAAGFAPSYGVNVLTITDLPAGECVASISPTIALASALGGTASVTLTIAPTCAWTVESDVPWMTPLVTSGTGNAVIEYTTEPILEGSRTGHLIINTLVLVVEQSLACTFTTNTAALSFEPEGGIRSVEVFTAPGCAWTASTNVPWLTVTSGASGSGPGSFTVVGAEMCAAGDRIGTIEIGSGAFVSVTATQTGEGDPAYDVKRWEMTGDALTDMTVWRPATGLWYVRHMGTASASSVLEWGSAAHGDRPVPGDYDGDGLGDYAVWRPGTGEWHILKSTTGYVGSFVVVWGSGAVGDVPVPADYDGDLRTDIAVWRPATGMWFVSFSSSNFTSSMMVPWGSGAAGDRAVPGDYDGDGQADIAFWRPSTGAWQILRSFLGYDTAYPFVMQWGGQASDVPVTGDYDGDGTTDMTVWRAATGTWYVLRSTAQFAPADPLIVKWGDSGLGDMPVVGDYDGDGHTDLAVWRGPTGGWYVLKSSTGFADSFVLPWGTSAYGDVPMPTR